METVSPQGECYSQMELLCQGVNKTILLFSYVSHLIWEGNIKPNIRADTSITQHLGSNSTNVNTQGDISAVESITPIFILLIPLRVVLTSESSACSIPATRLIPALTVDIVETLSKIFNLAASSS